MKIEEIVIVVNKGMVQDVYTADTSLTITVIDLDLKRSGEDYVYEFATSDNQIEENKINELLN